MHVASPDAITFDTVDDPGYCILLVILGDYIHGYCGLRKENLAETDNEVIVNETEFGVDKLNLFIIIELVGPEGSDESGRY
jgi:hypothetical protein